MTVSAADFRRALGSWPSGVTVVTTRADQTYSSPHGITVSAFVSVSMDPPLILISIGNAATALGRIREAAAFTVNILTQGQDAVSNRFAGRPTEGPVPITADGAIEGALAVLQCRVEQEVGGGDHTLFIGRVEEVVVNDGAPLVYWRGKYRGLTE